ncbi:MAG TPA: hypothetical protein VMY77_10210 [Chitinophagaceae bacterium]|nr:hypothetical protein [Chitinophagaceae bacterium]
MVMQLDAFGKHPKLRIAIVEIAIIEMFNEKGLNGKVKIIALLKIAAAESSSNAIMFIM